MSATNNNTLVQPYLFFNGRCEEAIEFYRHELRAELKLLMRFKDSPDPAACSTADPEKIMHATLTVGQTVVMASDGHTGETTSFQGFGLSLTLTDLAEADRLFAALSDGGQVVMPQVKTFYSPRFGMVTDRFGVLWMVYVTQ